MSSWGAPAKGANFNSPSSKLQQSPAADSRQQNADRYQQRPSPYHGSARGRQDHNSSRGRQDHNASRGLFPTPDQPQSSNSAPSFSSDNPFQSQARFSADNPFQNLSTDSVLSSDNPYNNQRDISSPIHQHVPRPSFQPSPLARTPNGRGQPRFSPRTPSFRNFDTPPQFYQSPSPRHQTPQNRFHSGYNRGFNSGAKRGFGSRNGSFSNPGGSDDIQKYVNPSMLEDPWRDLPATPLMQTY